MLLQIDNIKISPIQQEKEIIEIIDIINSKYDLSISSFKIIKKSLDARNKNNIHYNYKVIIEIDNIEASRLLDYDNIEKYNPYIIPETVKKIFNESIIIIGSGPAGLFAALRLIESGAHVIIFERGKPIEERMKDIEILETEGILNHDSNTLFGEGGAGTYSDGKLTTRINKPEMFWFYKKLIENGAHESIAYEAKPHIGTDQIQKIIKNIRNKIISSGSEIRFNEKVTDLYITNDKINGIATSKGNEFFSNNVILATGHSARDIYTLLHQKNVSLEKKGFAIGVRVEHPIDEINKIQYGNSKYMDTLPAAEYTLTYNNKSTNRGVYSFCMCPGGSIINSSSEDGALCVNGMSMSKRDNNFSNAAIVVTIKADDTDYEHHRRHRRGSPLRLPTPHNPSSNIEPRAGKPTHPPTAHNPLSGIDLQREIETKAFIAGGGDFKSPAQRIDSFINNKSDNDLPDSSYKRGVIPAKIEDFLPSWITDEIREGLKSFNNKMHGFISPNGMLIGAETRTSSPIRITRDESLQSISVKGLYPVGEGSGYSGGIVSSAVDGIRTADMIIEKMTEC
ncbi:MAG: NAD(P)/FAD-dependent oxidoreductase [Leptospirales bacterium]|nr:NAD(P)/FAD-dependent oxidoreductase [Leptospirales bacterium]